jgi:probable HAF family extracellular repeat protein
MKSRFLTLVTATAFLAVLAMPFRLAAQDTQDHRHKHHHYKLIDVGTFGGPGSSIVESQNLFSRNGTLVGWADTTVPDPNCLNHPDCLVEHGFEWRDGVLTDLGALLRVNNSQAQALNDHGLIVGNSQNGLIDPYLNIPATDPVAWANGEIFDLGTFGGYQGYAFAVNESGQATGVANNSIADQYSFLGGTQSRAFLWEDGTMQDLNTLGGPDAFGQFINDHGQVAGFSHTSSMPGPSGVPPYDAFLWDKHTGMKDLGNLGGSRVNPWYLNNRGEVVGDALLAGDQTDDPFLWDGQSLRDLGTFGGNFGRAQWVNEAGDVVGTASYPDGVTFHAALWRDGKKVKDLGTLAGDRCSWAVGINSKDQIVGLSFARKGVCAWGGVDQKAIRAEHAFLWEDGSLIDLNTRIPPNSGLRLALALDINDRGEIAGVGLPPGVPPKDVDFHGHAFVLIPCDEHHPGVEGCDYSLVEASTAVPQNSPAVRDAFNRTLPQSRTRRISSYRFPGFAVGARN